jgi:hypothetical protein
MTGSTSTENLLYLAIVAAGGDRPQPGAGEAYLRQLLRNAYEARNEAKQPLAELDRLEREAWTAAGVSKDANQ